MLNTRMSDLFPAFSHILPSFGNGKFDKSQTVLDLNSIYGLCGDFEICTDQLPKFVAYPSLTLGFFDIIKTSPQLSFIVEEYIIIISIYCTCFGINIAYSKQVLRWVTNLGR